MSVSIQQQNKICHFDKFFILHHFMLVVKYVIVLNYFVYSLVCDICIAYNFMQNQLVPICKN